MAEGIVADLGGTNCRIGICIASQVPRSSIKSYRNADFASFESVLSAYLEDLDVSQSLPLCAGVAGPVRSGRVRLTNYPWTLDAQSLAELTGGAPVYLVNDLQAQAYALESLPQCFLETLHAGRPEAEAPRLVVNLGTGFNTAVAHRVGEQTIAPASEAGFTSLPDLPELRDFYDHLQSPRFLETALSASGLSRLHTYLTGETKSSEVILSDPPKGTLGSFISLFARASSDACLAHMATGGLYLTGGVARALAPHLDKFGFHSAFCRQGPYADSLARIPIHLMIDDTSGLIGCASYLLNMRD